MVFKVIIAIDGMVPAQPLGPMVFDGFSVSQSLVTMYFNGCQPLVQWCNGNDTSLRSKSLKYFLQPCRWSCTRPGPAEWYTRYRCRQLQVWKLRELRDEIFQRKKWAPFLSAFFLLAPGEIWCTVAFITPSNLLREGRGGFNKRRNTHIDGTASVRDCSAIKCRGQETLSHESVTFGSRRMKT